MSIERILPSSIQCIWNAKAVLGESPCWDTRSLQLWWLDIKGKQVHQYSPANQSQKSWKLDFSLSSIDIPSRQWNPAFSFTGQKFLGCGDDGFGWVIISDHAVNFYPISNPEKNLPDNRFNDGKLGSDNRYWAGTMHDLETEATGKLYAFSLDGNDSILDSGYMVTNGPAFSKKQSVVYHSDSARQVIYAFNLNSDGTLSNKRDFVRFAPHEGFPDGMTVDQEDNLWVAMWDGSRIEKFSSSGKRIGHIPLPVKRPTSCVFSDDACTQLYVTSASIGCDSSDTLAGGVFLVSLG